jgi:hypothetical protein
MTRHERGIVLDISNNKLLLATPSAEFVAVPREGRTPNLGEEICFSRPHPFWLNLKPFAPAAAAGLILLLVSALILGPLLAPPIPLDEPAYFIALDINPSFEMGINLQGTVVSFWASGDDSGALARQLRGLYRDEALRAVLFSCEKNGCFVGEAENYVLMTVAPGERAAEGDLPRMNQLKKLLTGHLKELSGGNFRTAAFFATRQEHKKARAAETSVGRYVLQKKLPNYDEEKIRELTTAELLALWFNECSDKGRLEKCREKMGEPVRLIPEKPGVCPERD